MLRVTCPSCRTDYAVPASQAPRRPLRLVCPACGRGFRLEPEPRRPAAPAGDALAAAWSERLARALVSDIVVYQPERRRAALERGRVLEEFVPEIAAAWRLLLELAGDDPARLAPVFRDALDTLLGAGAPVVPAVP
ncbi:MAG: zinc-ribbon domain-containing protein [bacterium]|nr:zinc-ribbon domain-containing protein [bacterium]